MKTKEDTVPLEMYLERVKALSKEVADLSLDNRKLKKEIQELKHLRFETKHFHGQLRKDFSWGWFEHIEYGEDGGTGNFTIELDTHNWEIVDCDGCYDVPK